MATSTQLIELDLNEISGVDHPANLHEGWLVLKSSNDPLEKALASAAEATTTNIGENMELTHDETEVAQVEKEAAPLVDPAFRKEVADLRKELADAKAEAVQVAAERELEKAATRSEDWAILPGVTPSEFAPVLRSLHEASTENAEIIEGILDGCATALNEAGVLKELGTEEAGEENGTAWDKIEGLAKGLVESGEAKSIADGIGKAAESNPDVYAAYIEEMGG